ncbi:hypothetical protein HQ576_18920 [bacterium]|nr:hypothetical protein [bacterium]
MPVTRPPVALLYSLSHVIHAQTKDRTLNYAHAIPHGENLPLAYLAGKLIHHQFLAVVDEDVVDGTLAAHHRAVILTSLDYLAPAVLTALEDFAAAGGLVLLTADCTVKVKGATTLPVAPAMPDAAAIKELAKEKKYKEMEPYVTTGKYIQGAMPLAKAIQVQLVKAGIRPIFACDNPGIAATRQAAGDVEYLFAVNAEYDFKAGEKLSIKPAVASIALPADGRPVYDAVRGGAVAEFARQGTQLKGTLRFGPGQMRVFARTARPIGSVKALAPIVQRDLTADAAPIGVNIGAVVLDAQRAPLSGSMPLRITLTDPLGVTRYGLYRATQQGTLRLSLPLAANDPAGEWKVTVRELLGRTTDTATFTYQPLKRCAALAGGAHRAVCFAPDIDRVFRFVRVNQDVTIVTGTSGYNAAATRLAESLEPWDVRCKIVAAADVNRPRELTPEEAPTWVGIEFGRAKVGRENNPAKVGFDVKGPVILLGTPKDNPLIAHLLKMKFLPYEPRADEFPGRGRGYLAWQRDGVGHGQESVTLIAYDAQGMSEAVGSFYEAAAGLRPLTRWTQPSKHAVAAATTAPGLVPEPKVAWRAVLPDRAVALQVDGARLVVTTHDGSRTVIAADGKVVEQKAVATSDAAAAPKVADASLILARKHCPADRIVKHAVPHGALTAVGYWGGTLQLLATDGTVKCRTQMPQDITGLASLGGRLAVSLADGCVVAVVAK